MRGKPKLMHIVTRFERGGPTQEIKEIVESGKISKHFKQVLVVGSCPKEKEDKLPRVRVIRVRELVRNPSPFHDAVALLKIYRVVRDEKPDIVHLHTSKAGFLGRLAVFLAKKLDGIDTKVIYSPHGHIFYGYFPKPVELFYSFLETLVCPLTDCLVGHTPEETEQFEKRGCSKTRVVPRGVRIKRGGRTKIGAELSRPVVGTVARLEKVKGVEYLILAFRDILRHFPTATLLVVGDGSERQKLEELARKNLPEGSFVFTGWVQNPDFSVFDVFVLPSLNESWGASLCEAGAFGVPLVATRVGGIPYFAEGKAILVEPASPESISSAVVRILSDPSLAKRLSQGARELAKFTVEKMLDLYLEIYLDLLKKRSVSD